MQHLPTGPHLLCDRPAGPAAAAVARFAAGSCDLVSAVRWRTAPEWSIPPRTCSDTLLFAALAGTAEVQVRGRWSAVEPGYLAVIPAREVHAARYREGCRLWDVIALHVLQHDASGADLWAGFAEATHRIPGWQEALLDLVALHNRGEARAAAPALLRALAGVLLVGGAEYAPPPAADARIAQALRLLADDPAAAIADVAERVGLKPARFRQRFQEVVGLSPKAWLQRHRLERAAHLLATTTDSVQAIAAELAFASSQQFHAAFKRAYGRTAGDWRRSAGTGL